MTSLGRSDVCTALTEDDLRGLYAVPASRAQIKEIDHIGRHYRAFIERSPFVVLATGGTEGFDCSPRGGNPGFVRVQDDRTLLLPDHLGNNRLDSLTNIVRDPRVAMLFLIPGCSETLRTYGRAAISAHHAMLGSFAVDGRAPATVVVVTVQRMYYHCGRSIARARLWDASTHAERGEVPTIGMMLKDLSNGAAGGDDFDKELQERLRTHLY
jgi:PPOX class probable FMN-dependent enzyme